jgi:hypothetical protein
MGKKWPIQFLPTACDFHGKCRDLLHAANLQHGTDSFTSLPKEDMLRNFSPKKSDGFSRVWTRELGYQRPACQQLDHWSRLEDALLTCSLSLFYSTTAPSSLRRPASSRAMITITNISMNRMTRQPRGNTDKHDKELRGTSEGLILRSLRHWWK